MSYPLIQWVLFFCYFVAVYSSPLLEIDTAQYEVSIEGTPLLEKTLQQNEVESGVSMVNKFGQRYICRLPPDVNSDEDFKDQSEIPDQDSASVTELLAPMAEGPCLFRTKDWWTYELCFQKVAKQYHLEDGRPSSPVMILGYYDHDLDWPESPSVEEQLGFDRHHKQFYTNGTNCDLTGEARKTEVRFECDPMAVVDYIDIVEEPQSCEYLFVVKTMKICEIPHLRPPPTQKPKPIECSPVLSDEEYDSYEKYLIAKEKYKAKKALERKTLLKNHMIKILDGEDLSDLDLDTDEGLSTLVSRAGEKYADRLVSELTNVFSQPNSGKLQKVTSIVNFFSDANDESVVDEVTMPNGEKQSRLKKVDPYNWFSQSELKHRAEKQRKIFPEAKRENRNEAKSVVNLDPRSDLSDEDEMIEVLLETFRKMAGDENRDLTSMKEELEELRKVMSQSFDELVDETENEMNLKLSAMERHQALDHLSETFADLMAKLDATESDIARINKELEKVQQVLGNDDESKEEQESSPNAVHKKSKTESKVTNDETFSQDAKLKNSESHNSEKPELSSGITEESLVRRLESALQEKLEASGLNTGGRQIEVKLITSLQHDELNGDIDDLEQGVDDSLLRQHMMYNFMVGDQIGYKDIVSQIKTERNYKFSFDAREFSSDDDAFDSNSNESK